MSTLYRIVTFALLSCFAVLTVQAQKIGYTDQEAILVNMPEMQNIQEKLQKVAKQQQQELQQERQQFQQRVQRFQKQQSLLSDSVASRRERELQQRQQELQRSMQNRQQQIAQRERELMQPLLGELQTAINDVAEQENIDIVMRTQALLYVNQNSSNVVDITQQVATNLGIDLSGTETQPEPSVQTPSGPTGGGPGGGSE